MHSTDLVAGRTYSASALAAEPVAFVRLDDDVPAHLARVVSSPTRHALLSIDQIGYRGPMPAWVSEAFGDEEEFLLFLEETPETFVFLGSVMPCAFRSTRDGPSEIAFYVPDLPRPHVAKLAPHLLDVAEPTSWSATSFIELTRTAMGWTARALGCDLSASGSTFVEALSIVENDLADRLLASARSGEEIDLEPPDTSTLRDLGASFDVASASRSRRVLVQVGYFSSDLALPGWAMSRDALWVTPESQDTSE